MSGTTTTPTAALAVGTRPARRLRIPVIGIVSMCWLALLALLAIFGPLLPLPAPNTSDYSAVRLPPFVDAAHLLGTDNLGRDILARLISGAGVSLAVGLGSVAIAATFGTAIGAAAGYFAGATDRVLSWVIDILLAFPTLIALIAITSFMGPSMWTLILSLGIVSIPMVARVARSAAMAYAQRDFVYAAKAIGTREGRILWRDILPNIAPTVISFAVTLIAIAIVAEGAMSFLGLGVPTPQASWGGMMNEGRGELRSASFIVIIPAVVMCATLLAINFIADWINRRFDARDSHV